MVSLKEEKEQFVTGLVGGEISEIYLVTTIALSSYLSLVLLKSLIYAKVPFGYDYVINCLTLLASITLYARNVSYLHALIVVPSVVVGLWFRKKVTVKPQPNQPLLSKKPFISAYRSHMLILTNLAILAVDFRIFPRRFAKVETWGSSMMDLGVGSFVFSMGLVSSRALFKQQVSKVGYFHTIGRNIVKCLPLLVLGVARLVSVKSLDYQEHVTEYGIHWNFFITLGLLPILMGIFDPVLSFVPRNILALVISLGYDIVLNNTPLIEFILTSGNRMDNLLTMNKEGVFSFWGYFSLFLFGQSFAFVLTNYKTENNLFKISPQRGKGRFSVSTTKGLIITTIVYQLLFQYVNHSIYFKPVSRRLGNFPYVLMVVSYNSTLLLGYNVISGMFPSVEGTSPVLESTNNNGLAGFLLGNVGTGLVNMTINTLGVKDPVAFLILNAYCIVIVGILVVLDRHKIYIKI